MSVEGVRSARDCDMRGRGAGVVLMTPHRAIPLILFHSRASHTQLMGTKDNRVDSDLNKHVWSKGIR